MDNVLNRLRFRSANRCNISAELEFVASHFDDFLPHHQTWTTLPFSFLYEIIGHRSLRIENEDGLYDFIRKGTKMNPEMFCLLEFVRFEYCSTDVMNDFFDLLWESFYEINASMWAILRTRLVLPTININKRLAKQFPPLVKKGKVKEWQSNEVEVYVPDGIIAHLTRECGGNVHDRNIVDVVSGSFERVTYGANPHSGAYNSDPMWAAKNAADLETSSRFYSAYRKNEEDIPHTRNNWVCYDFKERRIVPTHYAIRTNFPRPGNCHLKSWLVETSADGQSWREVAREEDNEQPNGPFAVADGGECRFIRLVNIGRNHWGDDRLRISVWEIFGSLVE
jgi:hypothetical protein